MGVSPPTIASPFSVGFLKFLKSSLENTVIKNHYVHVFQHSRKSLISLVFTL